SELDLLLADGMLGRFSLLFEIGLGKAKRFEFADLLRIDLRTADAAAPPLGFPFLNLLLNPRFCVDEAFSGITHKSILASLVVPHARPVCRERRTDNRPIPTQLPPPRPL